MVDLKDGLPLLLKVRSCAAESATLFASAMIVLLLSGCASNCACGRPVNPHLTLNLGPNWSCTKDESETACRPADGARDRTVIWTIKERAQTDTLETFRSHLSSSQPHDVNGKSLASRPISLREDSINGVQWIDAVKIDSEVPGFNTRYLASVDSDYAVVVTFSAKGSVFDAFSREMQPVIDQLVVRR